MERGEEEGIFVFLKFSIMNMCYFISFRMIKSYYGAISLFTFSCFTYKVGLLFNCLTHGSQMFYPDPFFSNLGCLWKQ